MNKEILNELNSKIGVTIPDELIEDIAKEEENNFDVYTTPDKVYELIKILREDAGIYHLSTVTGMEKKDEFVVIYHLQHRNEETKREIPINVFVTKISKEKPKTPSMVDFYVCADYYEREVYDFFGIYFENHPYMERLILPEKWPSDIHPLRKEYSVEDLRKIVEDIVK